MRRSLICLLAGAVAVGCTPKAVSFDLDQAQLAIAQANANTYYASKTYTTADGKVHRGEAGYCQQRGLNTAGVITAICPGSEPAFNPDDPNGVFGFADSVNCPIVKDSACGTDRAK
jgi:hypothetical protein